jgi:hypothetical protein
LNNKEPLVKSLIDHFVKKGLQIKFAKYSGFDSPPVIKRHSPDVLGFDEEKSLVYIGLAKSCEELNKPETIEQFEDFSKRVMKNGKSEKIRVPLCIAVPTECHHKIKEIFDKSSLTWKDTIEIFRI